VLSKRTVVTKWNFRIRKAFPVTASNLSTALGGCVSSFHRASQLHEELRLLYSVVIGRLYFSFPCVHVACIG